MYSSRRRRRTATSRMTPARSSTHPHYHKPHKAPQVQVDRAGGRVHKAPRVQVGRVGGRVHKALRAQVDRVVAKAHKPPLDPQVALKCSTSEEAEAEAEDHHHHRATAISASC